MIDRGQIEAWVKLGESETLEFKSTTGERREATRALCAMLNYRGGRVVFGIMPDRRIIGQQVSDHTIEEVAQEIKELDPPAFPSIDRVPVGDGKEALVVGYARGARWLLVGKPRV